MSSVIEIALGALAILAGIGIIAFFSHVFDPITAEVEPEEKSEGNLTKSIIKTLCGDTVVDDYGLGFGYAITAVVSIGAGVATKLLHTEASQQTTMNRSRRAEADETKTYHLSADELAQLTTGKQWLQ